MDGLQNQPAAKRRKLDFAVNSHATTTTDRVHSPLFSLSRSITPPDASQTPRKTFPRVDVDLTVSDESTPRRTERRLLPSPFQLTRIRDLPAASNVDTVSLRDILGDPMIRECWHFNFLFDVDFLM